MEVGALEREGADYGIEDKDGASDTVGLADGHEDGGTLGLIEDEGAEVGESVAST